MGSFLFTAVTDCTALSQDFLCFFISRVGLCCLLQWCVYHVYLSPLAIYQFCWTFQSLAEMPFLYWQYIPSYMSAQGATLDLQRGLAPEKFGVTPKLMIVTLDRGKRRGQRSVIRYSVPYNFGNKGFLSLRLFTIMLQVCWFLDVDYIAFHVTPICCVPF